MNKIVRRQKGFSLIELLAVVSILSILSALIFGTYLTTLARTRDARRKEDLQSVRRALEIYYSEYEVYPTAAAGSGLGWGAEFNNGDTQKFRVYMKLLPKDPLSSQDQNYAYTSPDSQTFRLYTCLENEQDPDKITPGVALSTGCGGVCTTSCNYGTASTNASP